VCACATTDIALRFLFYFIFIFILFLLYFYFKYIFICISIFIFFHAGKEETIPNNLKKISVGTVADCLDALKEKILKKKIFVVFPDNDTDDENKVIINAVLELLMKISIIIFARDERIVNKEEAQKRFEKADGYTFLQNYLTKYQNINYKEQLSIILGMFYFKKNIPRECGEIMEILIDGLKIYMNTNNDSSIFCEGAIQALYCISISGDGNKERLYELKIIGLLTLCIEKGRTAIADYASGTLANVIFGLDKEKRLSIARGGMFDILHKKLLKILPLLPKKINPDNYELIEDILLAVGNLLSSDSDSDVVNIFVESGLPSFLLSALEAVTAVTVKTEDYSKADEIEKRLMIFFMNCSEYFEYDQTSAIVDVGIIGIMMKFVEECIKVKGKKIKFEGVENAVKTLNNVTIKGLLSLIDEQTNDLRSEFEKVNGIARLYLIFEHFKNLKTVTEQQKKIMNDICVTFCQLHKSMRIHPAYRPILLHLKSLTADENARNTWDYLEKPDDDCLANEVDK
jgi:hypothetical protein